MTLFYTRTSKFRLPCGEDEYRTTKRHGLFIRIAQYGVVYREFGLTRNLLGEWQWINWITYYPGWPPIRSLHSLLHTRVRIKHVLKTQEHL